jgi:hypothetical protein
MKNKLLVFGLMAAMVGAAAGIHYRIPIVIAVVCVGLAVFCAMTGVQMIVTRKAVIATSDGINPHREYHSGLSAQFWGVLFLMFSVPIGGFGVSYWLYGDKPPSEIIVGMFGSPLISGIMMVAAGVAVGLYGLTRVISGKEAFVETGIGRFERLVLGGWAFIVGAVVVLAGWVRVLAPDTLTRLRDGAVDWVLALVR